MDETLRREVLITTDLYNEICVQDDFDTTISFQTFANISFSSYCGMHCIKINAETRTETNIPVADTMPVDPEIPAFKRK